MKLTDGVTSSQGGLEYEQFIKEIRELRKRYRPDAEMPGELATRRTAILWSHENLWDHQRQSQSQQWDLWSHVLKYHRILKSMGAPVDYISQEDDFTAYPFLIVPAYQAVDHALVQKWNDYANHGGRLIITCRTGCKTRAGHFWEGPWAQPVTTLIGADITGYDMLLPNGRGQVTMEEKTYIWNNWADLLVPHDDTQVLATYSNQFYEGRAAVVTHRQGDGSVTYVGVDTDDAQLERRVLQNIFQQKNIQTENYPLGVYVYWRDGFWIVVNYSSESYMLEIPDSATILFGHRNLAPTDVAVWTQ
jgi:beta-galactosidase